MEVLTSNGNITLKHIFLDNGNWWKFFLKYSPIIRFAIVKNVLKMLGCRTPTLGYRLFRCTTCSFKKRFCFSCKSRFCPSCGKKATDIWMQNAFNRLPQTRWQHITFTMPDVLWDIFWHNRHLINKVAPIAADIIKTQAKKQRFIPGIYLAIHTFGRDLKRNLHIHLSTTVAGLSFDYKRWISKAYFEHQKLKDSWKYQIITLLRKQYKDTEQPLILPAKLKHLRNYTAFNSWLNFLYQKKWGVHLGEQSDDHKNNTQYLGKYLKRPPIGETRIKAYDRKEVTYQYLDHYTKETHTMTLPVLEFIGRVVTHIPDQHFRTIRYYGFLSNRLSAILMPIVYMFLGQKPPRKKSYIPWIKMLWEQFHYNPLICPHCAKMMALICLVLPSNASIISQHQQIAHGFT